jgi:hypothetical protein
MSRVVQPEATPYQGDCADACDVVPVTTVARRRPAIEWALIVGLTPVGHGAVDHGDPLGRHLPIRCMCCRRCCVAPEAEVATLTREQPIVAGLPCVCDAFSNTVGAVRRTPSHGCFAGMDFGGYSAGGP